jgi:condensin-2 complex subunit D3
VLQDRCLDLFEELVLGRVLQAGGTVVPPRGDTRAAGDQAVPKEVATVLGALTHQGAPPRSCIARLCSLLAAKGHVKPGVAKALQRVIIVSERWGTGLAQDRGGEGDWPAPRGAWLLLAELSAHTPAAVSWEFLQSRWEKLGRSEGEGEGGDRTQGAGAPGGQKGGASSSSAAAEDRGCLLKTIVNVAARFPEEAAAQLAVDLLGKLRQFSLRPSDVGPHLEALVVLGKRSSQGAAQMGEWAAELVGKAGDLLGAYVLSKSASPRSDPLIPPPADPHAGGSSVPAPSERTVEAALFTVGALVAACSGPLPPRLVTLVQALVAAGPEGYSPQVTAHAWVALGKLCLADERLAKRCMPLLVQVGRKWGRQTKRPRVACPKLKADVMIRWCMVKEDSKWTFARNHVGSPSISAFACGRWKSC